MAAEEDNADGLSGDLAGIEKCIGKIDMLEKLVKAQQRRIDAQEVLIEELCQDRCEVCLAPETAIRVFSDEARWRNYRATWAFRASMLISGVMFGVVSKVMYSHYRLQYCFELFYKTAKDVLPELEEIDFNQFTPLYFSPISASEATTAPLWFVFTAVRFVFLALLHIATVIVDRVLKTVLMMLVFAGGVMFVFKNFDAIVDWIREDRKATDKDGGRDNARDVKASASSLTAIAANALAAGELAASVAGTLQKAQWSSSTQELMDRNNDEESTTSSISFTGPVTRQRAKAIVDSMSNSWSETFGQSASSDNER